MKDLRNTLVAGGSALVLALSLSACGGSEPAADTSDTSDSGEVTEQPVKEYSHDAELSPEDINPGWVVDSDTNVAGTSDLWYPVTDDADAQGLYFTNAGNDAGIDVTFVDNDGNEDSVWDLEIADNHLVTKADATDKRQVDITFQDDFTCYDAVGDVTYTRGTADLYKVLFEGQVFVEDESNPDNYKIEFDYDDGTFTRTSKGDTLDGTWEVKAVNVAVLHYATDTSEWDEEVRVILDEGGNVAELDEGASTNLVVYEG